MAFYHISTRRHNSEDFDLNLQRREHLKCRIPYASSLGAISVKNVWGCIQTFSDYVDNGIKKTTNTRWEATKRVMAAKLIRLTHKIAIQLYLVAESCTTCSSRSRRPVRRLLDTPSYKESRVVPVSKHRAMKAYRGMVVGLHPFLTSVLYRGEWSASRPGRLTPIPESRKEQFMILPRMEPRPSNP
jgi:hypothetical protein